MDELNSQTDKLLDTLDDSGTAYRNVSSAVTDYFTTIADTKGAHWAADIISDPFKKATAEILLSEYVTKNKLNQKETEKLYQASKPMLEPYLGKTAAEEIHQRMMDRADTFDPRSAKQGLQDLDKALDEHWLIKPGESVQAHAKSAKDYIAQDFYDFVTYSDQSMDSTRKAISDFWENSIIARLTDLERQYMVILQPCLMRHYIHSRR
ncbi:MAG: hypothetical protein NTY51_15385 [Deltaproteobacteria bacterium]|nr:hypothetical protein [Deltaproteobacteria bacterium]